MIPAPNKDVAVTLTASREDGERTTYQLAPGRSVLVGRSKDCGLRLDGKRLSPCHCLLSLEDGTLWVQDWASTDGTLLNGKPIDAKVSVGPNDQLGVGEYHISAVTSSSAILGGLGGVGNSTPHCHVSDEPRAAVNAEPEAAESYPADVEAAIWAQDELLEAAEFDERRYSQNASANESFEQETIALLREEIDALQGLLAERDAQLAESSAATGDSVANRDVENDEEDAAALLARMEDLLQEAACGDERVVLLEEMLRTAEEANQAEQEERQQLEAWVGDIERRIIQRDELRDAEVEALRGRLEDAIAEQERLQRQLQEAASLGDAAKCYEQTLDRLQHQNKDLQDKLAETASERAALMKRLENSTHRHDEAMREERAAIAQERAIVSRLRCELANKVADLENSPKPVSKAADEAATRLRALRDHLREIHLEEQQQEHQSQESATLTSRITRLWKRLEN